MRDAFGVELPDEVAKAFGLRPVADFVKGAATALGRKPAGMGPMTQAGARGTGAGTGVKSAYRSVKSGLTSGAPKQAYQAAKSGVNTARAGMPKIPRPSSTQMKVGGAIAGTAGVAGAAGYAAGKPDWKK